MKNRDRVLALFLALMMVLQLCPAGLPVFAAESAESVNAVYVSDASALTASPAGYYWDAARLYYADGASVSAYSLSELGVALTDYHQTHTVSIDGKTLDVTFVPGKGSQILALDSANWWTHTGFRYNFTADGNTVVYDNETAIDAAVSVTDTSKSNPTARISSGNTAGIDHAQDIYLEQTLKFDSLPVCTVSHHGVFQGNGVALQNVSYQVGGFYFFLWNRTGTTAEAMLATVQNVGEGKLKLFIANSSADSAYGCLGIDLGVSVGQEFVLGTTWNADGSADVYVNDRFVTTVADATRACPYGHYAEGNYYVANYTALDGDDGRFAVSNVNISAGRPKNAAEDTPAMTLQAMFGAVDLQGIIADLEMPYSYPYAHGALPLTWVSSAPEAISSTGKVSRGEEDIPVTLTAYIGERQIGTVEAVVKKLSSQGPEIPAYKTEKIESEVFTYPAQFVSYSETLSGKLDARWDSTNLYLSIQYSNATALGVTIGDYTKTAALGTSDTNGTKLLTIPLADAGIMVLYSNQVVSFRAELSNAAGRTASLADGEASLYLTEKPTVSLYSFPEVLHTGTTQNVDHTTNAGVYVFSADTYTDTTVDYAFLGGLSRPAAIDHSAYDLLLQQTICVEEMPVSSYTYNKTQTPGLNYYMVDRLDVDGDGDPDGDYCPSMMVTLLNAGSSLVLHVADTGVAIDLGKTLGETFKLGLQWNRDDSLDVYVDGIFKGYVPNATQNLAWCGSDNLSVRYNTMPAAITLTLSDVAVYQGISPANAGKLTQEGLGNLVADSNPDLELTKVTEDILLPVSYTDAAGSQKAITWTSTNPAVVTAEGKVTRQMANYGVTLTASVDGTQVGTLELTVLGIDRLIGNVLNAAFTASAVTLDGVISEEGWTLNTAAVVSGETVLRLGSQWDKTNLYLALQTADIAGVTLSLAGKAVELSGAVTSGTVSEIAVPFASIGVTVGDYGTQIPMVITLGASSYSITLELCSVDWFSTDNAEHRLPVITTTATDGAKHGVVELEDGYYIYDHYGSTNLPNTRNSVYFRYPKADTTQVTTVPVWPADESYYFQFDFLAVSMPAYSGAVAGCDIRNSNYGVSWSISGHKDWDSSDAPADVVLFGMYNNGTNLVFVVSGEDALVCFPLDKKVGDQFRVGIAVDPEGNMTVYIDGQAVRYISNAEKRLSALSTFNEDAAITFRAYRNAQAPGSSEDNIDVYMTGYAFGVYYGESVLDSLDFAAIKGSNTDQYAVVKDLVLPSTMTTEQLPDSVALTWQSSHPAVISSTGTVTRPSGTGQLVTLTVTTEDGRQKQFELYVKGLTVNSSVLTVQKDLDPTGNAGVSSDSYRFTLDTNNNSVVVKLSATKRVTVVKLTDGDDVARLHPDVLELYTSTDNKTYKRIENFKLLHSGQDWYLYGFSAVARYVKVHCTHYDGSEADFIGPLESMITAYNETDFGAGGGSFATTASYTLVNKVAADRTDAAFQIPAAQLGDIFLAENCADARFYLDGALLYHYYENGSFYVRIPQIAAGGSLELTVKAGNASAMDISNKEYVHEMIYGTREANNRNADTNNRIARTLTMSNGVVIGIDCHYDGNSMVKQFSYDGGRTWTAYERIPESVDWMGQSMGFIHDTLNDRVFFLGYDNSDKCARTMYSDDHGITWQQGTTIGTLLGYVDGIELSCNDGSGPNVDMVIGMGGSRYDEAGNQLGLQAAVGYSADGGITWSISEDHLFVETEETGEAGISENSIYEMADGTLVMYARWQVPDKDHFAVYYSYDHGINWTTTPVESQVYTVNTNPVFLNDNGTAMLLWSGNAALGGTSYRRVPLSLATSTDREGLMAFENIQDLYVKYSLQGLDTATQNQATNPHVSIHEDTLLITWFNSFVETLFLRVENYRDFLYKTKGAYDSFEGRSAEYEGWATIYGNVSVSREVASHGSSAMLVDTGAAVARSFPSVSDGSISMDVYLPGADAEFELELQTAFSNDASATPIVLAAQNGALGGAALKAGWNSIALDISMGDGKAALTVNGAAASVSVDWNVGSYLCYAYLVTGSNSAVYVDNFTVIDRDGEAAQAAEYDGRTYATVQAALDQAGADSADGIVALRCDAYEAAISVPAGVTLDLKGHALNADSLVSYGAVKDSVGTALLRAEALLLAQNNGQLPLYDESAAGYRFFDYGLKSLGTRSSGGAAVFGIAPEFSNADAYALLGNAQVQVRLSWDGMSGEAKTFSFSAELLDKYAQLVEQYPSLTAALLLTVSGLDTLEAGTALYVVPVLQTAAGTSVEGSAMSFTVGE